MMMDHTVHNIIEPSANAEGSEEAEATWREEEPEIDTI